MHLSIFCVVEGGRALQKIFGGGVQQAMKKWTQRDLRFCKNEGSKNLTTEKKGVNKIENRYKCFKMVK